MYYRGDYYRGDYYRGDPGFFSSLGRIAGGVLNVAGSLLPGPVGGAARIVGGALNRASGGAPAIPSVQPFVGAPVSQGLWPAGPGPALGPLPGLAAVNASMATSGGPGPYGMTVGGTPGGVMKACGIKGTHVNRSSYYRRTPGGGVAYIEKGSVCVKNRSMNPFNPRALRRAERRAHAFLRGSRRLIKYYVGKRPKGKPYVSTRRKRG